MPIDIKFTNNSNNIYDINYLNGDLESTESFETAIQASLLLDIRADSSEKPIAQYRRGWFGNDYGIVDGHEMGSKLWLLDQARNIQDTLNRAVNYTQSSLQWLIDDGHAKNINVSGSFSANGITITIVILRSDDQTTTSSFILWNNTLEI